MNLQLENKLALVTGSTAGIGFAIAKALAAEGARVIINGRTAARVAEAIASIRADNPSARLEALALDLSKADATAETMKRFPDVDILVNNLGVYQVQPFEQITDAEWLAIIKDFNLPLLDEPVPPSMGQYSKPHTKKWAAKVGSFDGYAFVAPEYNHGISGALKNAIDFLFAEWNNKAAGFVTYGRVGGARAVEQLRLVMAVVQIATVRNQVLLSLFADFENFSVFKPDPRHEKSVNAMLD
jgi:NAD(P)H-dependent FMN reductase